MIALYVIAIVVVCGLVAFYFFWTARKHKRSLDRLKFEGVSQTVTTSSNEIESDLKEAEKEVLEEEKTIEHELEDFVFSEDLEKNNQMVKRTDELNFKRKPFEFEDDMFEKKIQTLDEIFDDVDFDDDDFDDFDDDEENRADMEALMNFDFDSIKGKSREQVSEMIKDFSPTVQDFILNDIMNRKSEED